MNWVKQKIKEIAHGLEENFKASLRWASVQGMAVFATLQLAWIGMPAEAKAVFPEGTDSWVAFVSYMVIYLLRTKKQPAPKDAADA